MPRKPKPKNTLSAGQRAAIYREEQEEKLRQLKSEAEFAERNVVAEDTKPRREQQKPQHAVVNVDFSIPAGRIKPMHGVCNGPLSHGSDLSALFREIGVPQVRFHDTDSSVSRFAIDVSRIFPDFSADESDPSNYRFDYTDKYIKAALDVGARVIYRLGESRDVMGLGGRSVPPSDIDKWARICVRIIKHYNSGWAAGFEWGLDSFEVWSAPDSPYCWRGGSREAAFALYAATSRAVKLYDENIKIGGMSFGGYGEYLREFVKYCRKNSLSLDFLSLTSYSDNPEAVFLDGEKAYALLQNMGYTDCELILSEWNYIDGDIKEADLRLLSENIHPDHSASCKKIFEAQKNIKGAAFAASVMLSANGKEGFDSGCYFDAQPNMSPWCGIADRYGAPEKTFYAFKAYGELYCGKNRVYSASEQYEGMRGTGIYAAASLSDKREGYIMLSAFDGCSAVDLRLDGIPDNCYTADIYMLDGVKDLTLCDSVALSGMRKRILLSMSAYGVVFIKVY